MGNILKAKELNEVKAGTMLFREGDRISYIGMLIKGSIRIRNDRAFRIAGKGEMIALADVFAGEYVSTYVVEEDAIFYPFPAFDSEALGIFLNSNFDYRGIVIDSMEKELMQYLDMSEKLFNIAMGCYQFLCKHYEVAVKNGLREAVPEKFLKQLPEDVLESNGEEDKIAYYREAAKIPLDIKKKYFFNSEVMTLYQAEEIAYLEKEILEDCKDILQYLKDIFSYYINEEQTGLLDKEMRTLRNLKKNGSYRIEDLKWVEETKEKIYAIHQFIKDRTGEELPLDKAEIEGKLNAIQTIPFESQAEVSEPKKEKVNYIRVLQNSLKQILEYAALEENRQKEIQAAIQQFIQLPDKLSTQDTVRRLKKQITGDFFDIYKVCLFKWLESEYAPLAVELFLNYGYIDEHLLDEQQLIFLSESVNEDGSQLPIHVYRMPEWLREIYKGNKDTSRDSFERDYRDFLREEKRSGNISGEQERAFLRDKKRKVLFEVDNMFKSNNKIVNGKLSTYVPILYKEQLYGDMKKVFVSKQKLCEDILELESMDFSVFYREVLYQNPELKIEKEYVMKRVYPDVILAPVYGTNVSMWQEITGKKRDTAGRFIFPVFSENEVKKLAVKALGRFHWEYCRCEQGASWNNIQYKSLTSEYMDYIQYYRKNHDLSEERREKIRAQIQKARNNSREIFLSDYEMWVYSESRAAMKLNKVSRQILATYCPFNKEIRENLKKNAAFTDAMQVQQKRFGEKAREWELRIKKRENSGLAIPKEFRDTYEYYKDR